MFFKTPFKSRRRLVPALVATTALIGGLFALGFSHPSSDKNAQVAAAARASDQRANRGSGRTPLDPTTTVAPTTTTAAPATTTTTALVTTTTTTAAPTTTTAPKPAPPAPAASGGNSQTGGASYYAQPWAAKGCAHKTLPKGTVLTVTNLSTGKSTTCTVNDRGPFVSGRIVDLDTSIFDKVASTSSGVFQARISW